MKTNVVARSLAVMGIHLDGAANAFVGSACNLWGAEGDPSLPVYPRSQTTPLMPLV